MVIYPNQKVGASSIPCKSGKMLEDEGGLVNAVAVSRFWGITKGLILEIGHDKMG